MYNVIGMLRSKGFTLIELMIVMGLIAVLSAGLFSVFGQGSQRYSRDVRRQADLQTIAAALAMYRQDQGSYPRCGGATPPVACAASAIQNLAPYLAMIPADPVTGRQYSYYPRDAGGGTCTAAATDRCVFYTLCAGSEKDTTTNNNVTCASTVTNPCGSGNCVYIVRNQ